MIYFAMTHAGSIKIGATENVGVRLQQLRAEYGGELTLLAAVPGGEREERAMHERFAHLRLAGTEQFRQGPELMTFISGLVDGGLATIVKPRARPRKGAILLELSAEQRAQLDRLVEWKSRERGSRYGRSELIRWLIGQHYRTFFPGGVDVV